MVLHYRMFCNGLPVEDPKLHEYRSHFIDFAESKWDTYTKLLKSCVPSFPVVKNEGFDFAENYFMRKNIFDKKNLKFGIFSVTRTC